jgi:hypothetical protein
MTDEEEGDYHAVIETLRGKLASCRASHAQLLEAAKETLPLVVAKDFTKGRQYVTRLRAAIAAAEELAP